MKVAPSKVTFHDELDITSTTAQNSNGFEMTDYERLALDVEITKTGSPSRIRLYIQTRMDSDDTWKTYSVGYAQAMYWNANAVGSGLNALIPLPDDLPEGQIRCVAAAEGTVDGSNYWTITVKGLMYAK